MHKNKYINYVYIYNMTIHIIYIYTYTDCMLLFLVPCRGDSRPLSAKPFYLGPNGKLRFH